MDAAAFYSVSDSRHFLGAVALVNSLRLAGHREPIYLADCGLTEPQRTFLSAEVQLVPTRLGASAHLLKWNAPGIHQAEVQILLDADLIILRRLTPLLEGARRGKIVAFADPVSRRFYGEWGDVLQLGTPRRMRYCNAGALALPRRRAEELLPLVRDAQSRIDVSRSMLHGGSSDYPFYFPDQDVWNAVFATRTTPQELIVLKQQLAPHPPFEGLRQDRASGLVCRSDGTAPYLLHHVGRKPWLAATPANLYSQFLPRYLLAADLPLRLPESAVPARLRSGTLGNIDRQRVAVVAGLAAQRGRLGIRRRFTSLVRRDDLGPGAARPVMRPDPSPTQATSAPPQA